MKTIKKLTVVAVVLVLLVLSVAPSTFSWYTHSDYLSGNKINYNGDTPISVKSATGTISMTTYVADAKGEASTTAANSISLAADSTSQKAVQYYKTTFTNSGNNDVYLDLNTSNLSNNADFVIGTLSPTLNEKAYASRAVRNKKSSTTTRVYFRTTNSFKPYWTHWDGDNATVTFTSSMTNDFNIAFKRASASSVTYAKLSRCPKKTDGTTASWNETYAQDYVFYYDLPSDAEYFYFFNHWFFASSTNTEWNRTLDITTVSPGKVYYLTGGNIDGKHKEYAVNSADNTNLVYVSSYYSDVRMSLGTSVYAEIGLRKTSDDPDFIPEYYGSSIGYTSASTSIASVNGDGKVIPNSQGSTTITTTITGQYGDTMTLSTAINIPQYINQVPIITNLKVPAGGETEVLWYALNKSSSATMTTASLFYTI